MTAIKKLKSILILFPVFIVLSALIYLIQIWIFKVPDQTYFYLLQDLAFIPIQVLIVSFLINRLLYFHEQKQKTKKINVIISAFFVECGTAIIESISPSIENINDLIDELDLGKLDYDKLKNAQKKLQTVNISINSTAEYLEKLKVLMTSNKAMMLAMLENSSLLEHDSFTDMLWSVFHVTDELLSRNDLSGLPNTDIMHLNNDITRAYRLLVYEWLDYMKYLKAEYSYLFSLAVRKNPYAVEKNIIIK